MPGSHRTDDVARSACRPAGAGCGTTVRARRSAHRCCASHASAPTPLFALHQLEEPALLAVLGALLIKEREIFLVELVEEFVPADFVEFVADIGERNAQDAGVLAALLGSLDRGWTAAAGFGPAANLVVIGGL